jgi:hypothetical protein
MNYTYILILFIVIASSNAKPFNDLTFEERKETLSNWNNLNKDQQHEIWFHIRSYLDLVGLSNWLVDQYIENGWNPDNIFNVELYNKFPNFSNDIIEDFIQNYEEISNIVKEEISDRVIYTNGKIYTEYNRTYKTEYYIKTYETEYKYQLKINMELKKDIIKMLRFIENGIHPCIIPNNVHSLIIPNYENDSKHIPDIDLCIKLIKLSE